MSIYQKASANFGDLKISIEDFGTCAREFNCKKR